MESFLSWSGWSGVSAVAQLLALATILGAAWRFILQRRQMPAFVPDWGVLGNRVVNEVGDNYHVIEFRNLGVGSAEIYMLEFYGASVLYQDGFLCPRILGPGGTFRLLVTAPTLADVWFRLTIRTPDVRRRFLLSWHPLTTGPIQDQWTRERDGWSLWKRSCQALKPSPVLPGHATRGVFRGWKRRPIEMLRGEIPAKPAIYSLGTHHNFNPPDLPYIPPHYGQ